MKVMLQNSKHLFHLTSPQRQNVIQSWFNVGYSAGSKPLM